MQPSIGHLMLIAYNLVLLTFSTGVLILALPVPLRGLKAWSGRLISDSIAAFVLMTLYWTLIEFSDKLPLLFGWSWPAFGDWYAHILSLVLAIKALIVSLLALAKSIYASKLVATLLSPLDTILNIVLLTMATIGALMIVVRRSYLYLAALGVVLYALPFRLGKSAGASLLAFAIVFNAGLPLMPAFLSAATGAEPEKLQALGATFAEASVVDYSGRGLNAGIVHVYIRESGELREIARYIVGNDSRLMGKYGYPMVSLPTKTPSYWMLEIDGVTMPLEPYPLNPSSQGNSSSELYSFTLRAPYMVYQDGYKIVYMYGAQVEGLNVGGDTIYLTLYINSGGYVEADAPSGCTIELNHTGPGDVEEGSWSWLGVEGTYKRFTASQSGYYNLTISIAGECNARPRLPPVKDYVFDYLGFVGFSKETTPKLLTGLVILPAIYLFILSSISFALARLLGGRERLIPRL